MKYLRALAWMFCLPVTMCLAQEMTLRDPMRPMHLGMTALSAPDGAAVDAPNLPPLPGYSANATMRLPQLQGLMVTAKGEFAAIVNERAVLVHDEVDGYRVKAIDAKSVELTINGQSLKLKMPDADQSLGYLRLVQNQQTVCSDKKQYSKKSKNSTCTIR